jgi:hypothetical protein
MDMEEDITDAQTNAQAIIEAVERLVQPSEIQLEADEQGRPRVVALPQGLKLHSLKPFEDERRTCPERKEGTANHSTLVSFVRHALRFSDEHSALFAQDDPRSPRLLAVFDYHESNERDEGAGLVLHGEARFGKHRSIYHFPLSPEWLAWTRLPEQLTQRAFAEFLEDHIIDVLDPGSVGEATRVAAEQLQINLATPGQLLTLSKGLSVRVDRKVVNHVVLSSGESQLVYEEKHQQSDGGAPLKVPDGFVISLPVFRGGAPYVLIARLRYSVQGGAITWGVRLHRVDRVFQHAFDEAAEAARAGTELPLFYGTPE